jgi:hypothetical protein
MRVYDRPDVPAAGIDPQVNRDLRGCTMCPTDPPAVHPDLDQVLRAHIDLRHSCRGDE